MLVSIINELQKCAVLGPWLADRAESRVMGQTLSPAFLSGPTHGFGPAVEDS